ncbi:MAG: hypothetical protein COX19_12665 [Desulfobacterales bacterium CG23_combo_of_CG06-09_8_20_14_all_51_8]|nr:MAG: hypothetical protein COX19_12665 [Desulfobacterales bacterium CG23_combo_of_CG06-09_8_20_14_all_51_8]
MAGLKRYWAEVIYLKDERRGRNPATAEYIMLPARKILSFKWSGKLKDRMNGRRGRSWVSEKFICGIFISFIALTILFIPVLQPMSPGGSKSTI